MVMTVGMRKEFLDAMPAGTAAAGQRLIAATLDAIFRTIFEPQLDVRAAWRVVRSQIILDLVNACLAQLAKLPLAPAKIETFGTFIKPLVDYAKTVVPRALTREERMAFFLDPDPPAWYVQRKKWPYG